MWPLKKRAKPDISKLEEEDAALWDKKRLDEDEEKFEEEAGFLNSLLKRFKRL